MHLARKQKYSELCYLVTYCFLLSNIQKYDLRYENNENFTINTVDQYLSKKFTTTFFNFKNTITKEKKRKKTKTKVTYFVQKESA
jgi:hypothetical protein